MRSHVAAASCEGLQRARYIASGARSALSQCCIARAGLIRKRVVDCLALDSRVRKTLPIFPLSVVALPAATVPLMIFEARYRVLFNTLLSGMEGIEEGLVQTESEWCGTKRFGMCYVDNEGRMAGVGTTLEVVEFKNQPDGRLFVINKGREKFRVIKVAKEKPVMLCEVEVIPEQEETAEAKHLADEVAELLRNTIKLNAKMRNISAADDQLEPEELSQLKPAELSYWVASFFEDVKLLQQNLLEEESTIKRLQKEKDILSETVRYYSAAAALKGAFSTTSSEPEASEPDAGGKSSEGGSLGASTEKAVETEDGKEAKDA